jgi:hypothetical protein
MTDYFQIILTAMLTGIGTGLGIAIGTYFANKALFQNFERIIEVLKSEKKNGKA